MNEGVSLPDVSADGEESLPVCPHTGWFSGVGFESGEVYLFHRDDPHCPSDTSLWGLFDKSESGTICLESSTEDLLHFRHNHTLAAEYRYCRQSTRPELRDYVVNEVLDEVERPVRRPAVGDE